MKNLTTGLPSWAKGAIVVAAIGGAYLLYRKIDDLRGGSGGFFEPDVPKTPLPSTLNNEISQFAKNYTQTYPDSNYVLLANKLFTAMYGYGTDEEAIYSVFRLMKNDLDVAKLIKAFGVRKSESSWAMPFNFAGEGDLAEWLAAELDDDEMKIVNGILMAAKNPTIKFRF